MKLEQKHIIAYNLGEKGVKIITSKNQGEFTTVITQIDFTETDLFYGNSYLVIDEGFEPYVLNGAKLILLDIDELTKDEAVELGWVDEEHLKRGIESGKITQKCQKHLVELEYDIFNLIDNDLAVSKSTLVARVDI